MRSKRIRNTVWVAVAFASLAFLALWLRHHKREEGEDDTDYYGQYR